MGPFSNWNWFFAVCFLWKILEFFFFSFQKNSTVLTNVRKNSFVCPARTIVMCFSTQKHNWYSVLFFLLQSLEDRYVHTSISSANTQSRLERKSVSESGVSTLKSRIFAKLMSEINIKMHRNKTTLNKNEMFGIEKWDRNIMENRNCSEVRQKQNQERMNKKRNPVPRQPGQLVWCVILITPTPD